MAASKPRPRDWHPLAESDPVPGDPESIRSEAKHMRNVAKTLREQAGVLKKMSNDDELKGKYAGKLREKSGELEKNLREVAGRYERVNGDLDKWADDLEECQTQADSLLRKVQNSGEGKDKAAKDAKGKDGDGSDDPYDDDKKALKKITDHRDDRADHHARNIRGDIGDILKDSWWERVVDYVKIAIDVLSWTATIIGLVALFITPVGWIAAIATIATGLVMAGHVLLAITGDGSWMDVGMDAFSLLTMGMGAKALKGLKGVQAVTRKASSKAAGKTARAAKGAENNNKINNTIKNADRQARKRTLSKKKKRGFDRARIEAQAKKRAAENQARATERNRELADAGRGDLAKSGGDKEFAQHYKDIQRMRAEHPNSPEVARASQNAEVYRDRFRVAFGAGLGADLADKGLGTSDVWEGKPYVEGYNEMKQKFTVERG